MNTIHHIYVVSDATGLSAETTARAAIAQFALEPQRVRFHRFAHIADPSRLEVIVLEAQSRNGLIVSTLGDARWAEHLAELADQHGVPALDLLSPVVTLLARTFNITPKETNLPHHRINEEYFRRVEAIEFSIQHDDGKQPQRLQSADIVLIGVSRSSKTPLSMYLANLGYKVANLPLVLGVPPPAALESVPRHKVFGVTIDLETLLEIRRNRVRALGSNQGGEYTDAVQVQQELDHAESVMRRGRYPVIQVTGRAIEETANEILRWLEHRSHLMAGREDESTTGV